MKLDTIIDLWYELNLELFGGRLSPPSFGRSRSQSSDGHFHFYWNRRTNTPKEPHKCRIYVSLDTHYVVGTMAHEMIHQYQFQVWGQHPNHDEVFGSIARKFEKIIGEPVR